MKPTQIGNKNERIVVEKLKYILREKERQDESLRQFDYKRENMANVLKTTLKLVSDDPGDKFNYISKQLKEWIDCSEIEMEMIQNAVDELNLSSSLDKIKKQDFGEKTHMYRESFLSVLFQMDKNIKSLYYLILTLFLWLLLWVIINDVKNSGQLIDTRLWRDTFKGGLSIVLIWVLVFSCSFLVIPLVKLMEWTADKYGRIHYLLYFIIYCVYQVSMYLFVFLTLYNKDEFGIPCRMVIAFEVTRLSLKMHGYFREKTLFGLKKYHMDYAMWTPLMSSSGGVYKGESSQTIVSSTGGKLVSEIKIYSLLTESKKYLYYLFCPSLIYRDSYPRIPHHRWHLIMAHSSNIVFCILFYYILMRYICEPYFNFSKIKDYNSLSHFLFDTFRFAIPGVCFLVVGFFLFLHSWMNLWSELLCHGDRRFYEDWWNCTNFEEYYRKWNMVVHEWLYYYVYNDVLRLSLGKLNRTHAKLTVFALSVFLHELIIWISLGFFFPILSFLFGGPGVILTYIRTKKKQFNIVFWIKLFFGKGLLLVFYFREFNVRALINEVGIIEPWHEWLPRTLLMYFDSYKNLIQNSRFY